MKAAGQKQVTKQQSFKDITGEPLKSGDVVRVIGVPDLAKMHPDCRKESLPVFEHLLGKYKRIREFDEFGLVWLSFKIRSGQRAVIHWVGIEPYLLRRRRTRASTFATR